MKKPKKKMTKELRAKMDTIVAFFREFLVTPGGQAFVRYHNYEVRRKKFELIMGSRLGPQWELELCYDLSHVPPGGTYRIMDVDSQPYDHLSGLCHMTMLETLDRAGLLTDDLTPEQVQMAAQQQTDYWNAGRRAGKAWASEHAAPEVSLNDFRSLVVCRELAQIFDVEAEYGLSGDGWLDGFKSSVEVVWWHLPVDSGL